MKVKICIFIVLISNLFFCNGEDASGAVSVSIPVKAVMGSEDAVCSSNRSAKNYSNIGATSHTANVTLKDMRFYIHDVKLVDAAGKETSITLDESSSYQSSNVVLLDFEDGTGSCTGNSGTNKTITGTVPAGLYTGIKFTLGVPFSSNHQDVTTASAPLNESGLFWNWRFGYKFLRIDFIHDSFSYNLHLGSTGCSASSSTEAPTVACKNPNTSTITLNKFTLNSSTLVLDIAELLASSELDVKAVHNSNTGSGGAVASDKVGCMSSNADPDCKVIFNKLGLNFTYSSGAANDNDGTNDSPYTLNKGTTYSSSGQSAFKLQ